MIRLSENYADDVTGGVVRLTGAELREYRRKVDYLLNLQSSPPKARPAPPRRRASFPWEIVAVLAGLAAPYVFGFLIEVIR